MTPPLEFPSQEIYKLIPEYKNQNLYKANAVHYFSAFYI